MDINSGNLLPGLFLRDIQRPDEGPTQVEDEDVAPCGASQCSSDDPTGNDSDSLEPIFPVGLVVVTPPECAEDVYLDDTISEISEVEQEVSCSNARKAKRSKPGCEDSIEFWETSTLASVPNRTEVGASADSNPGRVWSILKPLPARKRTYLS